MTHTEYNRIHVWINKNYGKACKCTFCDNKEAKKYEWALKQGCEYAKDINNFIELCASCHRRYDYTTELGITHSKNMKAQFAAGTRKYPTHFTGKFGADSATAKAIARIDKNTNEVLEEYKAIKEAVDKHSFKYPNISLCLSGKNKTAYGFKWKYKN